MWDIAGEGRKEGRKKGWTQSDDPLRTPTHGRASVEQPARTNLYQFCVDTGCSREDLLGIMNDRDEWQMSVWMNTWYWSSGVLKMYSLTQNKLWQELLIKVSLGKKAGWLILMACQPIWGYIMLRI